MIRGLKVLALLACRAASVTPEEQGDCLVNSGEAVSDAMDASLFIWASYKRCTHANLQIKCEIDVSNAVKSVNSMINVILKVASDCKSLHTKNKECGFEAGKLTEHMAALSAASGQVAQKCPALAAPSGNGMGAAASPVLCTVDLKNTAKGLFAAVQAMNQHKDRCQENGSRKCSMNILDITASLAGMGQFLAGSVGQCRRTAAKAGTAVDTRYSLCAQASAAALEYALKIAEDGVGLSKYCSKKPEPRQSVVVPEDLIEVQVPQAQPRLYEAVDFINRAAQGPTTNLVLGAALPLVAILSFVAGRSFSSRRMIVRAHLLDIE